MHSSGRTRSKAFARPAGGLAALLAAALLAGCAPLGVDEATTATPPPRPQPPTPAHLHGPAARAAGAVYALDRALRDGDVEALCRPGAIFTAAVVADLNAGGTSCEASEETSSAIRQPPRLTVVALALRRDLAVAQVRARGRTVPVDIVRDGRRWLVSFSGGDDPLGALDP